MASLKQIEANRRNAQKSAGPRTEQGRAAVRFNGLKHGLTAQAPVLPGESVEDFEALRDSFVAGYQPANPSEEGFVHQMVMARWRLLRLYRVETAFYAYELEEDAEYRDERHPELDDDGKLAYLIRKSSNMRVLNNLERWEAHFERAYRLAFQALERIRKQPKSARPEAPVVPIGFALQKTEPPSPQPEAPAEPAARRIGFALQKSPDPAPDRAQIQPSALSAIRRGTASALGAALHRLPPIEARPWIWIPPISAATSASAG